MSDPELARVIDVPLKAKLYRIDPGVKIFRCKVQTPPGKQFEIRAEAYRRIEAALDENRIAFADNTLASLCTILRRANWSLPKLRARSST